MKKFKLPNSYYNYTSFLGTITAAIAFITLLFLIIAIQLFDMGNVYTPLYAYLIVPIFLIAGLLMIAIGMIITNRRVKMGLQDYDPSILVVNLKNDKTRNALIIFLVVTVIFIISTVVGTYKAFHYSESVEFCGKLCHRVMEPEYVAYQNSPHAKVKCAECHIGAGVDWFVKAKISGLRQVYKYGLNSYERPIATPIENLRPARETCEKCHWPQKFYGNNLHRLKYFLADETNTEWDLLLNMKIGAGHESKGFSQGIHWHINPDITIEYITNKEHDTIFTVKVTNSKTGTVEIYNDAELEASDSLLATMRHRTMDCMDCHNRPSHEFRAPSYYVNHLFASNQISSRIPWLKSVAMAALKVEYTTRDSADMGIRKHIMDTYQSAYPDVLKKYSKEIEAAIVSILKSHAMNAFPDMGITYKEYPRHIGHLETDGCFRCHNDRHRTAEGKTISKDCALCHTILAQGTSDSLKYSPVNEPFEFVHPVDISEMWRDFSCSQCHQELY